MSYGVADARRVVHSFACSDLVYPISGSAGTVFQTACGHVRVPMER